MKEFESRVSKLESEMVEKCSISEVRDIVRQEIDRNLESTEVNADKEGDNSGKSEAGVEIMTVMSEINERKQREANLVIYGIVEYDSEIREDRINYDKTKVKELCDVCKVAVEDEASVAHQDTPTHWPLM